MAARNTGDLDVWINRSPENANKLMQALNDFGFGGLGLAPGDFVAREQVVQLGYLLATSGVRIVGVQRYGEEECDINRATPGSVPVPRFGAADCRMGCGSHPKYLG